MKNGNTTERGYQCCCLSLSFCVEKMLFTGRATAILETKPDSAWLQCTWLIEILPHIPLKSHTTKLSLAPIPWTGPVGSKGGETHHLLDISRLHGLHAGRLWDVPNKVDRARLMTTWQMGAVSANAGGEEPKGMRSPLNTSTCHSGRAALAGGESGS